MCRKRGKRQVEDSFVVSGLWIRNIRNRGRDRKKERGREKEIERG